ncbi:hypothetical protein [Streptomyces sp. NPDC046978]|uniref:hypothetical protein n=1 Tax=Streptomyces sp. NPDC046978 TaxID=3154704 RepID=UPI003411A0F0
MTTRSMAYADDPIRLARLLRDLAQALQDIGVDASGSSAARHLMDDALHAAQELDPSDGRPRSRKLIAF